MGNLAEGPFKVYIFKKQPATYEALCATITKQVYVQDAASQSSRPKHKGRADATVAKQEKAEAKEEGKTKVKSNTANVCGA